MNLLKSLIRASFFSKIQNLVGKFQLLLFPEGFKYSIKNREYRTSKTNVLFDLTDCFKILYEDKKQKTHQNIDGLVDYSKKLSNQFLIDFENLSLFMDEISCVF